MKRLELLVLILHAVHSQDSVIPSHYNYSTLGVLAANGSSATGGCSDATPNLDSYSTCATPTSSVLFDGVIPTLTALDGDTWASQLLVLRRPLIGSSKLNLYFSFNDILYTELEKVEVVIFNCPEWNNALKRITVEVPRQDSYRSHLYYETIASAYPTIVSCDSLVKVCIPFDTINAVNFSEIRLSFKTCTCNDYYSTCCDPEIFAVVYLAEVVFSSTHSNCTPFTTIPGNWSYKQTAGTDGMKSECKQDLSLILSATSMVTALQTAIIVLLVVVVGAVCKCNRRKTVTLRHPDITGVRDPFYETVNPEQKVDKICRVRVKEKEEIETKKNSSYAVHLK